MDDYICITDMAVAKSDSLRSADGIKNWLRNRNTLEFLGTYAHKDIAFEFASAISPVFKLYLIKEFQRLKEEENDIGRMRLYTSVIFMEDY